MEKFSFASALTGSFITAVFSYIAWVIQKYILMKSDRKRIAYFYLVKICEIPAMKKAAESMFNDDILKIKIKINDNKYFSHMICAGFSKILNNDFESVNDDYNFFIKEIGDPIKKLNFNKQECLGYKIDNEMVSKFPQSAILNYHFFIGYLSQLQSYIEKWIISLEQNDFTIFTPEYLYGHIECIENILESSEKLINALSTESGIKKKEVNNIINKQTKEYMSKGIKSQFNKSITKKYLDILNEKKSVSKQNEIVEKH